MRRLMVLPCLLLILLLTGCGSGSLDKDAEPKGVGGATLLQVALRQLVDLRSGQYTGKVDLADGFSVEESGSFDLATSSYDTRRLISTPDGTTTVQSRLTPKGQNYAKSLSPGTTTGCWTLVGNGADAATSASPVPLPVLALISARTKPARLVGDHFDTDVDAYLGLSALGVRPTVLLPLQTALKDVTVPLRVDLDDHRTVDGLALDGDDALAAIGEADVELPGDVRAILKGATGEIRIGNLGAPVQVAAPSPVEVAVAGASTCASPG